MEVVEIISEKQWKIFEDYANNHPSYNLWQSRSWYEFLNKSGLNAIGFLILDKENIVGTSICQVHNLPFGYRWYYIPRGPLLSSDSSISDFIQTIGNNKLVYSKIELPYLQSEYDWENSFEDLNNRFRSPKSETNPSTTIQVDIGQSEEKILAQMKSKGRYNVRLARRKGVKVRTGTDADISKFYNLISDTAKRHGLRIHSEKVYKTMLDELDSELFLAEFKEETLSGAICVYHEKMAIYYYGASSDSHRNTMSPYLLQYEMMLAAKARGCKLYDFMGIAPEGSEGHDLDGVTQFKKKFGGSVVKYFPGFLYVSNKLIFQILNLWRRR